jgi:Rrf2 family nitric oxide-sensitive transcriptional repressor
MQLAIEPARVNLGAVVRSIEPDFMLVECFDRETSCVLTGHCRLAGVISGALRAFLAHLDASTLADLLAPPVPDPVVQLRLQRGEAGAPGRAR